MTRFKLTTMWLAALLVFSLAPAAAQDDAIIGDPATLNGIESSIQRFWSIDFVAAQLMGTPISEGSLPGGLLVAQASVSRFASDDQAAAGYATLVADGQAEIAQVEQDLGDQGEVTTEASDAFGDDAFIYEAVVAADDGGVIRVVITYRGADLFMTLAYGSDEAAVTIADDLAAYLLESGAASEDPEVFDAAGASTGGLWGFIPPADDPVLRGLIAQEDEILFPVPAPAA